jgi:hypothetical protein
MNVPFQESYFRPNVAVLAAPRKKRRKFVRMAISTVWCTSCIATYCITILSFIGDELLEFGGPFGTSSNLPDKTQFIEKIFALFCEGGCPPVKPFFKL